MDILKAKKINIILFVSLGAVGIITGILSFCYALAADGLFCLISAGFYMNKKSLPKKIASPIWLIASILFIYVSVVNLTKTIGYYEQSPQIWCLPAIAVVILFKIYILLSHKDVRYSDEKERTEFTNNSIMGIIISAAVTAGLFGSYMVDYYIESAVFFGISLICLIYSFIQMKAAYLNEEKKKLKLEKKAAKKIHKLKSKVNKEPDFSDNEQPENSDIKDNE